MIRVRVVACPMRGKKATREFAWSEHRSVHSVAQEAAAAFGWPPGYYFLFRCSGEALDPYKCLGDRIHPNVKDGECLELREYPCSRSVLEREAEARIETAGT